MFGADYFYFQITKKMVIVFGNIFNNMVVKRTDAAGDQTQLIKVPIVYAAKEKMLARLEADPDLDRPYSALLPRMSFEILNISPARNRKLPTLNRKVARVSDNVNKFKYQYTPTPHDIRFNLYIYTKNSEDATKLYEQILPFFTPDWTASVELIPDMDEVRDIPFILDDINVQDLYGDDFKERRVLIWTLGFTCQTYFYGPIKQKPIIKFAETSIVIGDPDTETIANNTTQTITMQPGLDANGDPTTVVSDSVSYLLIDINDDWGFASAVNEVNYE